MIVMQRNEPLYLCGKQMFFLFFLNQKCITLCYFTEAMYCHCKFRIYPMQVKILDRENITLWVCIIFDVHTVFACSLSNPSMLIGTAGKECLQYLHMHVTHLHALVIL